MAEKHDVLGTLEIDNKKYEIIECDYGFTQNYSEYTPSGKTIIGTINLVLKVNGEVNFVDWMINEKATKDGTIYVKLLENKYRKIEFKNGYCIAFSERFDNYSSSSVSCNLSIVTKDVVIEGNEGKVPYSPKEKK